MPIDFSRPRHFTEVTPAAVAWVCPSCRAKNTSRFEEGCPACGAGTQAQLAAAQVQNQPPINLVPLVLGEAVKGMADKTVTAFVTLAPYTHEARETVAAALAFAAEHGMPPVMDGLERQVMIAWARAIAQVGETP